MEIQEATKRGAEFIELRLDFLAKAPDFKRLLADKACEMVATVRRGKEGGRWRGSEDQRLILLRQAIVAGFDWVDLETDVADQVPRFGNVKRIVSYHNLRAVPDDLEAIYRKMCRQDADVVKIAVMAQRPSDNVRVLRLLEGTDQPTVAFCMGEIGLLSRFYGAKLGQPFTYAAFNKERGIAPGLPSFDEMRRLYRYESIDATTPFYAVIGDPVSHSLSPVIHNTALARLDLPGLYTAMRIPAGELDEGLKTLGRLDVRGLSVTIPHKEEALALADAADEAAEAIGAANTLVREANEWHAYNTDAPAALECLKHHLAGMESPPTGRLADLGVLILGAGGVARAVAYALNQEGCRLTISNRTSARADALASQLGCRSVPWHARHSVLADVLINCTSVGMTPNVDEIPIHRGYLRPGLIVFDTVYTPENTLLVKEARARDCSVITGVEMFVRQAALQFELFTGHRAPLELMESVVRRRLSPVRFNDEV